MGEDLLRGEDEGELLADGPPRCVDDGQPVAAAWQQAAAVATDAAQQTASMVPKIGRARPLAERSVGTPDPGATSLAMCTRVVGQLFAQREKERSS